MLEIALDGAQRQALLALKNTAKLEKRTQDRLSTGLKVSNAAEGPESYFQAKSLTNRASDFLGKMDGIDQTVSLMMATQNGIDGITALVRQMKGIVEEAKADGTGDTDLFDQLYKQVNQMVSDTTFQGANLIANSAAPGSEISTTTHTVEFSDKADSKIEITGQFAGMAYYLSTGGDSKLFPDETGATLIETGTTSSQDAGSGTEVQVNTTTGGNQHGQDVAPLQDGGYIVVWEDLSGADGNAAGVFGQIYDASGDRTGGEFLINATTAGNQGHPTVTTLSDGSLVVTFQADGIDINAFGIAGQRLSSSGAPIGSEFLINTTNAVGSQMYPEVTALNDGGFVVTWPDYNGTDGAGAGVFANRFDADGVSTSGEFQVNAAVTAGNQDFPRVTSLSDGGFAIVWTDSSGADGAGDGVYAKRYDANGTATGAEFLVNTTTVGGQNEPDIAGLPGGGFAVTWHEAATDDIYVQLYDSSGAKSGSEFQVNTNSGTQNNPELVATADGGFLVTWVDDNADGDQGAIVGRRYDSAGTALGSEFQINTIAANDQDNAEMATLSNGDFVVTWRDSGSDGSGLGIFARRFKLGLTGGAVDSSSITSADYTNNQVTVNVGGATQRLTITKQGLGVANAWYYQNFTTVEGRDAAIRDLNSAKDTLRSISAKYTSDLALLMVRMEFGKNYSQTLRAGADKLVLADLNEEGANLLALQTRRSLGMNALSFVSQSVQGILTLFR
jgi:flagellin-like hook-associated protein FlgL